MLKKKVKKVKVIESENLKVKKVVRSDNSCSYASSVQPMEKAIVSEARLKRSRSLLIVASRLLRFKWKLRFFFHFNLYLKVLTLSLKFIATKLSFVQRSIFSSSFAQ